MPVRPRSASPLIDHGRVDLTCERLDALGEGLHCFRELSVLLDHLHEKRRLLRCKRLPFLARTVQILTMFRIGEGMSGVAVSLSGLRQQYKWSGVCGLKAKGEVQENERVDVECRKPDDVDEYPNGNDDGLSDEEPGCAKKASERFSLQGKPVVAKN